MITKDYLPSSDNEKLTWCNNLKTKIATHAAELSVPAEDVATIGTICQAIDTAIHNNAMAQANAQKSTVAKDNIIATNLKQLRGMINEWKAKPSYTDAIGTDLGIVGTSTAFDAASYKTTLTAELHPGRVTIKFVKKGVEGVNVYSRLKGETAWTKLAFDSHSPYEDNRPLATTGIPEHRQYMAIGVLNDKEIGLASDTIEVVFGG